MPLYSRVMFAILFWRFMSFQGMDGNIRTINNSRMTVDPEGNLWFSNITKQDENENSMYACSASSVFRYIGKKSELEYFIHAVNDFSVLSN